VAGCGTVEIGGEISSLDSKGLLAGHKEKSCHEIKPKKRQISKIVFGQGLAFKVRMAKPQATQALLAKGVVSKFRDIELTFVTDEDIFDQADSIDEHPDLTSGFLGQLRHTQGKFRGYQISRRNSATIEPFQGTQLTWFQAGMIAKELSYCEVLSQQGADIATQASRLYCLSDRLRTEENRSGKNVRRSFQNLFLFHSKGRIPHHMPMIL